MKYVYEVKMFVEVEADDSQMGYSLLQDDIQEMTSDVVGDSVQIELIGKANDGWDDRP